MARGIEPLRRTAANWLSRRFALPRAIDSETEILVLNGSREGLFYAAIAAARYVTPRKGTPAILIPNPFYPAYGAGARAANCETVLLPATRAGGFLPDLDSPTRPRWREPSRSISPRPPTRKARSPRAITFRD